MADYDNFANQYAEGMGEKGDLVHQTQIDPYIYRLVGNPKGKVIADLGCGNGYMARYFAGKGAEVYANDISGELIKIAAANTKNPKVEYRVHNADDLSGYRSGFFDAVVMNMSIHYLKNLPRLFAGISRVLKNQGIFAFSTNHFFRPSHPYSEFVKGAIDGKEKLFIKVTDYLTKRENQVLSGWDNRTVMSIYNHTLGELVNGMAKVGLYTYQVFEPEPVNSGRDFSEELQKSHYIPTFMIIGAKKLTPK